MNKKCNKCGASINEETDYSLCGYGKCVGCCGGCRHRLHRNPNYKEPKRDPSMATLDKFFFGK